MNSWDVILLGNTPQGVTVRSVTRSKKPNCVFDVGCGMIDYSLPHTRGRRQASFGDSVDARSTSIQSPVLSQEPAPVEAQVEEYGFGRDANGYFDDPIDLNNVTFGDDDFQSFF
jgi:hypothetical protein